MQKNNNLVVNLHLNFPCNSAKIKQIFHNAVKSSIQFHGSFANRIVTKSETFQNICILMQNNVILSEISTKSEM